MTQTLYHVTPASNLPGIRRFGLFTNRGERAAKLNAEKAGVFLFTSKEAVTNALSNWLGEEFENCSDALLVLELALPDDWPLEQNVDWEKISRIGIPAEHIANIHLSEPGEPIHIGEFFSGDSWICGTHSIVDGYPLIETGGERLIIKRSTLELVTAEAL